MRFLVSTVLAREEGTKSELVSTGRQRAEVGRERQQASVHGDVSVVAVEPVNLSSSVNRLKHDVVADHTNSLYVITGIDRGRQAQAVLEHNLNVFSIKGDGERGDECAGHVLDIFFVLVSKSDLQKRVVSVNNDAAIGIDRVRGAEKAGFKLERVSCVEIDCVEDLSG